MIQHYWSELKTKTLKLLPKWIIGSSAEQAADKGPEEKTAKRDLEGAVAEGGETVEPILDAFGAYSTCAMFTVYNVRRAASLVGRVDGVVTGPRRRRSSSSSSSSASARRSMPASRATSRRRRRDSGSTRSEPVR